jgi:hypothetical protein
MNDLPHADDAQPATGPDIYGDAYPDPTGSTPVVLDLDQNGVDDALVVDLGHGVTGIVVDVDEDGRPDVVLIDVDGDGAFETQVSPDGAGNFVIGLDEDGDGIADREQLISRDDLEQLVPGLADALDPADGPADGPVDDGTTAPAPTEPAVVDGRIIGDPAEVSEHWFQQAANGFCAPASVAQIVSSYTGQQFTDEQAFVQLANQLGVWQVGPDGAPGLTIDGALTLLEASGVPAAMVVDGDLEMLAGYLDAGHGIMVGIDSGEVWTGEATEDHTADHMVVVAGIDTERGVVLLSDPGVPNGNLEEVPIDVFLDAWADSDNTMIVAEDPAPQDAPAPADDSLGAAAPATTSQGITSQVAAATASTVAGPWVLLPVALPGASA